MFELDVKVVKYIIITKKSCDKIKRDKVLSTWKSKLSHIITYHAHRTLATRNTRSHFILRWRWPLRIHFSCTNIASLSSLLQYPCNSEAWLSYTALFHPIDCNGNRRIAIFKKLSRFHPLTNTLEIVSLFENNNNKPRQNEIHIATLNNHNHSITPLTNNIPLHSHDRSILRTFHQPPI